MPIRLDHLILPEPFDKFSNENINKNIQEAGTFPENYQINTYLKNNYMEDIKDDFRENLAR